MTRYLTKANSLTLAAITIMLGGCLCLPARRVPRLDLTGGPYYFSNWQVPLFTSWDGYKIPYHVLEEDMISPEKAMAKQRDGLCFIEAHFDKHGRIVTYKKYIEGEVSLVYRYTYGQCSKLRFWHSLERLRSDSRKVRVRLEDGTGTVLEERVIDAEDVDWEKGLLRQSQ